MHPDWYFKYFDEIFKRNNYSEEVRLINSRIPLINKYVLEIGSGLGYHSEEIYKFSPCLLSLNDIDSLATNKLKNKFKNYKNIKIHYSDGFNLKLQTKVDITLIFYSVLPQVTSITLFKERIISIFNNIVQSNGILAFEYIDYDNSLKIYPPSLKNLLYKNREIEIYITTQYFDDFLSIKYFGLYQNEQTSYEVDLIKLNSSILKTIFSELNLIQIDNISFDNFNRRKMILVKRASH